MGYRKRPLLATGWSGITDLEPFVQGTDNGTGRAAGRARHERGLAGAVFADQAVDAAGPKVEADVVIGGHGPEPLDDMGQTHVHGVLERYLEALAPVMWKMVRQGRVLRKSARSKPSRTGPWT